MDGNGETTIGIGMAIAITMGMDLGCGCSDCGRPIVFALNVTPTAGASLRGRKRKIVDGGSPGDAEIADSQPGATGDASTSSAAPPPAESSRPTTAEQPGTTGAQVSRWCQSLQLHVAAQLEGNNSKGYTCRDCQFTCRRDLLIGKLCLKYHVGDSCERQQMMRMVNYVRGADGNHMKSMEWLLDHRHLLPDEMP
jgi:hypothetical protein